MKRVFVKWILISLLCPSALTLACPSLAGDFTCDSAGGPLSLRIQQPHPQRTDFFSFFEDDSSAHISANGQEQVFGDGRAVQGTLRYTCEQNSLKTYSHGENHAAKDLQAQEWTLVVTLALNQKGDLVQITKGSIVSGGTRHILDTRKTCRRTSARAS